MEKEALTSFFFHYIIIFRGTGIFLGFRECCYELSNVLLNRKRVLCCQT